MTQLRNNVFNIAQVDSVADHVCASPKSRAWRPIVRNYMLRNFPTSNCHRVGAALFAFAPPPNLVIKPEWHLANLPDWVQENPASVQAIVFPYKLVHQLTLLVEHVMSLGKLRMSVPEALASFKKSEAGKHADRMARRDQGVRVVHDNGHGLQIVQLLTEEAIQLEGEFMQNCLATYLRRNYRNRTLYSLRDELGSLLTFHNDQIAGPTLEASQADGARQPAPWHAPHVKDFLLNQLYLERKASMDRLALDLPREHLIPYVLQGRFAYRYGFQIHVDSWAWGSSPVPDCEDDTDLRPSDVAEWRQDKLTQLREKNRQRKINRASAPALLTNLIGRF